MLIHEIHEYLICLLLPDFKQNLLLQCIDSSQSGFVWFMAQRFLKKLLWKKCYKTKVVQQVGASHITQYLYAV